MAHAGFEDGFLTLPRSWTASERGRRAVALLDANRPAVVRDLNAADSDYRFHEEARQRGYASMVVLPLRVEGQLIGSVHILAEEADAFDEQEVELLMATAGDLGYGIGSLRARARAAAAEEKIRRMADFDSVTGLPNRVRLRSMLAEALVAAQDEGRSLALLRIQMERFRDINETLGDAEVDKLVQDVAARLARTVGELGEVARMAESEFAVVLPRGSADRAAQLAQRIQEALQEPIELSGLLLDAASSIGISLFPGHGSEADALMRRAGIALDQARISGMAVCVFRGGLDGECAKRLSLMADLR
jgi:diguanylate cyclase (GGDEF)-like protein